MKRGFKKWAEEQARHWRELLNLHPCAPLPSALLADHLHVKFIGPADINGITAEMLSVLLGSGAHEWSAAAFRQGEGHVVIENSTHSIQRREATRMHEMAHIICRHEPTAIGATPGSIFLMRGFDAEQEAEADWLGACLHLPRSALSWAIKNGFDSERISGLFLASDEMVRYRVNITGLRKIRHRMENGIQAG